MKSFLTQIINLQHDIPNFKFWEKKPILFITEKNLISKSQIYPFYFYRKKLNQKGSFNFLELSVKQFISDKNVLKNPPEIVFIQPWWDIDRQKLLDMFQKIRNMNPSAKVVFLDSYAPTDLRLAEIVNDHVDFYVKKHVFRDRNRYGKSTFGDTNLVEYYSKLYGIEQRETTFHIPEGFLDKLFVGPSFFTARFMLPLFANHPRFFKEKKTIDLHARLGGYGSGWYGKMREHANLRAQSITGISIASEGLISHRRYMQELSASKICFSPFGFGEVCWRDYEAILCGTLLLKPECAHVETTPDLFLHPYETYVPLKWDFSDLEEKIRHYLANDDERNRITDNAYSFIHEYSKSDRFASHVDHIIKRINYTATI